jgi:hypothetical protein
LYATALGQNKPQTLDLRQFKTLYKKFSSGNLDKEAWQTQEYSNYLGAMDNEEIEEWYLRHRIKKSKVKVGRHCCTKMTFYLTYDKLKRQINPDAIIRFWKKKKIYGIPVHDGGSSIIRIDFCPWCSTKLTK